MDYKDAIKYLHANNIKKDDGTFYEFGDVCMAADFKIGYNLLPLCNLHWSLVIVLHVTYLASAVHLFLQPARML